MGGHGDELHVPVVRRGEILLLHASPPCDAWKLGLRNIHHAIHVSARLTSLLSLMMQMIFVRRSLLVRAFMRSLLPFVPLAILYGLMLYNSWSPDTLSTMMPGSLKEGLASG